VRAGATRPPGSRPPGPAPLAGALAGRRDRWGHRPGRPGVRGRVARALAGRRAARPRVAGPPRGLPWG